MRPFLALAAVGLMLLAGCVKAPDVTPASTLSAATGAHLVAFDGKGLAVPVPAALTGGLGVVETLLGERGGEPNIGVTAKGNIFTTAGHATMKSEDHGKTWTESFNLSKALPQSCDPAPSVPTQGCPITQFTRSSDPMLWVDPITSRVFTDHMTGLYCSNMITSDDEGASWNMKPMTCGIPVNDHQKVATAPPGPAAKTPMSALYPDVVYYCYNKLVTADCAASYDGGKTFPVDRQLNPQDCGGDGIVGVPAAAPDGTVFVPKNLGCEEPIVFVSEDSGLTWVTKKGPKDHGAEELDPDITVTPDGTAYMLYRGSDHLQYLTRSKDKFDTWEGPWKVSPDGVTSTVFTGITSQKDGKIAFAFLGTRDSKEEPSKAENSTKWYLYTGVSFDSEAATPTFVVEQASPDSDPVQIGCVWLNGGGNPCRNMLDFIDMASDKDGRYFVAFTDGCIAAKQLPDPSKAAAKDCAFNAAATNEESHGRNGAVATSKPLLAS